MSAKSPDPRKARCVSLSNEEHRRFINLGGSLWLKSVIAQAWDALPEEKRNWPRADAGALQEAWRGLVA